MKSEKISFFLQERIDAGDFPSAVYLVAEKGEIIFQDALGFAVVEPEKIEAKTDTIYDLASLTKVLITGLLYAKLIENRFIELSDHIDEFVKDSFVRGITFRHLLTHTSGYPAWLPFYLLGGNIWKETLEFSEETGEHVVDKHEIVQLFIHRHIPEGNPNEKVIYSDPNFIGLGIFLENFYSKKWGKKAKLDEIARKEVFEPLSLQNTFFNPPKMTQKQIAASEFGNEFEKQICIEQGFDISKNDWREYQIWGEVHDGNCHFMDGVSGHAGLFSTAEEIFKIANQFLANQTVLLKPETCALFRTNFTSGLNEARSIAFQLAETADSTASETLSKDSFGHLGFTGTSLWVEPETERIYILLTNRTHARKLPFANINSVRRRFHELAARILDENAKI